MNCPRHRTKMASLCATEFPAHTLKPEGEGRWYCGKPGTGMYGFRVITAPGALIVTGDIGECILRFSEWDALPWLRSALKDGHHQPGEPGYPDYLLSKVAASKDPPKEFLAELARGAIEQLRAEEGRAALAAAIEEELSDRGELSDGAWSAQVFAEVWHEKTEGDEVPDCTDWSSTMLRIYHALCTFVRLLPAAEPVRAAG